MHVVQTPKIIGESPSSDEPSTQADPHDETPPMSPEEHGGRPGPDPTRYGDWEKNGRCIDF